jgi:rSAM/selenodomain-associated transferase 2
MLAAMTRAFDRGAKRVVLVGTDIPDLSATLLVSAFEQLRQHELVIGPSTDGGYWLVGMNRPTDIFERISWSTPTVLRDTLALTRRRGLTASLLEPLSDLDEPADLDRLGFPASPYLSVIIPTLNEEGRLAHTLASARSPDADLIVSDGGSTDRTVACARAGGARIVTGPRGRARQQNCGAAAARGEILLFLHADTRLPSNYVNQIFDTLMDRRVTFGAFRFRTDLDTPAMRWISFWTSLRASLLQMPYGDQGLFLTRCRFEAAGGFPDVPIAEDLYLVKRLAKRGRIALAPACAVTSGRRWRQHGALRTTLINTIIATGCVAGIDPRRLAPLYRLPARKKRT